MPPLNYLRRILDYDPITGKFKWSEKFCKKVVVGKLAGGYNATTGYLEIRIEGIQYQAHRLAIFYMEGVVPKDYWEVDHWDQDKSNNAYDNLRVVTPSINQHNRRFPTNKKNRTSKYLGVSWNSEGSKWTAHIRLNGKSKYLGRFTNEDDAYQSYLLAKSKYHPTAPLIFKQKEPS